MTSSAGNWQPLAHPPPLPLIHVNNNDYLAGDPAYAISLLVLPTGQVFETDSSGDVEIYTPDGSYDPDWQPVVNLVPFEITQGGSYLLGGIRFNGMSQASMYGDEGQNATNYPLVRITNVATNHVFYSRTHDHSSMAVASPLPVTTFFDVPVIQETGPSFLQVIANGIPSEPVPISVIADAIFADGFGET